MSSYDPTDIRGQERAREDTETRRKIDRDTEESDLKWLLGSRRGRRIVWRLLEQSGVFRMSFNTNAMQMAFAEGNRNLGNRVLAQINAVNPEAYVLMMKEANERRNPDDGRGTNH